MQTAPVCSVRTTGLGLTNAFHRLAPALGHWLMGQLMNADFLSVSLTVRQRVPAAAG
jgi:hypothetical protein